MSADKGFIKIYRDVRDHWIWHYKPFSPQAAWIDLILLANHEKKTVLFDGVLIEVDRGQHMTSLSVLSDRWGWSRGKTKRFVDKLESERMLIAKRNSNGTLITLVKYGFYQGMRNTDRNRDGTETEQRRNDDGHKQETKKKLRSTKKNKKEILKEKSCKVGKKIVKAPNGELVEIDEDDELDLEGWEAP